MGSISEDPAGRTIGYRLLCYASPARTAFTLDVAGPLPADLTRTLPTAAGRVVWQHTQAELASQSPLDVCALAEGG